MKRQLNNFKNHVLVEILKSQTYEQINEMMNQLHDKINVLEQKAKKAQETLKHADRFLSVLADRKEGGIARTSLHNSVKTHLNSNKK